MSLGSTSSPSTPSSMTCGFSPTRVATIGFPAAIASRMTTDIASHSDGWKNTSNAGSATLRRVRDPAGQGTRSSRPSSRRIASSCGRAGLRRRRRTRRCCRVLHPPATCSRSGSPFCSMSVAIVPIRTRPSRADLFAGTPDRLAHRQRDAVPDRADRAIAKPVDGCGAVAAGPRRPRYRRSASREKIRSIHMMRGRVCGIVAEMERVDHLQAPAEQQLAQCRVDQAMRRVRVDDVDVRWHESLRSSFREREVVDLARAGPGERRRCRRLPWRARRRCVRAASGDRR